MSDNHRDKKTKRRYESIGTLSYRASQTSSEDSVFFVPDSDHLLQYSKNSYAVFVGPCTAEPTIHKKSTKHNDALAVPLVNDDDDGIVTKKSVPIKMSKSNKMKNILQVVRVAAEKQTKVTVTVRRKRKSFKLVGITLPPR